MEAAEYGETRGTWVSRAVSRCSRSPGWCGFRGVFSVERDFVVLSMSLHFQIHRPRAISVESVKGLQ